MSTAEREARAMRANGTAFEILYVKPAPCVPREPTKEEIQAQKNRDATRARYYRLRAAAAVDAAKAAKDMQIYGLSRKPTKVLQDITANKFNTPIPTAADADKTRRIQRGVM